MVLAKTMGVGVCTRQGSKWWGQGCEWHGWGLQVALEVQREVAEEWWELVWQEKVREKDSKWERERARFSPRTKKNCEVSPSYTIPWRR